MFIFLSDISPLPTIPTHTCTLVMPFIQDFLRITYNNKTDKKIWFLNVLCVVHSFFKTSIMFS